jgi:hypothetical protein
MHFSLLLLALVVALLGCGGEHVQSSAEKAPQRPTPDELRWQKLAEKVGAKAGQLGSAISGPGYEGVVLPCSRGLEGCWVPTKEEVSRFERALATFCRSGECEGLHPLSEYRRHYEGTSERNAKQIRALLFHQSTDYVRSGAWKTVRVAFSGGAWLFLRAQYDVGTDRVLDVRPNAPE